MESKIKVFESKQVRTVWNAQEEEWYFSVVDVVEVLTDSVDYQTARNYWKVLKNRLKAEGNETVTNCNQLKMLAADGKMRMTDVLDTHGVLRLVQSIPSPKAEPFKMWLAEVTTTAISRQEQPENFEASKAVAKRGGNVAKNARSDIETQLGQSIISPLNAKDKQALEIDTKKNKN